MEVQKHPHHVTHKKKWFEYLLEFFMLFLAVYLGFIAENMRETNHERRKEREYIHSLYDDLQKDTFLLKNEIKNTRKVAARADSAVQIIQSSNFSKANLITLYRLNRAYLNPLAVFLTDRTSSQLKNGGGLQLLRNGIVTEQIINYWSMADRLMLYKSSINELRTKTREKSYSIFDNKYYSSMSNNNFTIIGNPKLLTIDQFALSEFANRLSHVSGLTQGTYINELTRQIEEAEKLMKVIKNYYRFEN